MTITGVSGRAVFDSNGVPAIEVEVAAGGMTRRSIAPRGSTTGDYEAVVLEDTAAGLSLAAVAPALAMLEQEVAPALIGLDCTDQAGIDATLCALDGTPQKRRLGGNVCVAVSMAAAKTGAAARGLPLFRHLAAAAVVLPTPAFNIIDGSRSPRSAVGGVEFLLIPNPETAVPRALEMGVAVRAATRRLLYDRGLAAGDSAQGAFEVVLEDCGQGLALVDEAAAACGLRPRIDFTLGLDMAASDFHHDGLYHYPWPMFAAAGGRVPAAALAEAYRELAGRYCLSYVEDGFAETDAAAWEAFSRIAPPGVLVVGDDLFASSAARIADGARRRLADATLIKPNQVGTVTETLQAMSAATAAGMVVVVSQRSGENDDSFITHLAVAGGAHYLKAGGMARMDRVVKFNELLRLADGMPAGAQRRKAQITARS